MSRWYIHNWIILVFWATELDTDPSSSICQPSSIDNRSRGTVLDMDQFSFRISLVFWATELDTSLSSSICQPSSICRYRARGLSLFRGDKVKMVIELDDLSLSLVFTAWIFWLQRYPISDSMHQRKYTFFCLLFICNEFSLILCEQTNCTLHESRGLSRVDVAEKNYLEWL